jgi:hypothetical protein
MVVHDNFPGQDDVADELLGDRSHDVGEVR